MDERFLTESRRDPDPEFAGALEARLQALDAADARPARRLRPALIGAFALAAFAALFALPAVRVTAQQMLDLFRVREFAIVRIDDARLEQLKARKFDPSDLLGGDVETLQEPGPPQRFASIDEAANAAGFPLLRPSLFPRSLALDSVFVSGERRGRITAHTQPLRDLMDVFDIRDLSVPPGLEGQIVSIHVPRVVVQRYRSDKRVRAGFVQAESPEIGLPSGVELSQLGEIGLRILGLKPAEASRIARTIDWRSTLLIPVAGGATSFQQITVNGARGVYFETNTTKTPSDEDHGPGAVVMWTRDGKVYALMGNFIDQGSLVAMAESVH